MKTLTEFKASLSLEQPNSKFSVQLKSLWYDGKGEWHKAHSQVDDQTDQASAWVHAYLHRKEGDIWNADYWYNKAKQVRPKMTLEEEWEALVVQFLPPAKMRTDE
nr:hypothetical protein [uncultured Mucilaginibacter sp.]